MVVRGNKIESIKNQCIDKTTAPSVEKFLSQETTEVMEEDDELICKELQ